MHPDHLAIQNLLCQHEDGLAPLEIAAALQWRWSRLYAQMKTCPGIYIDRWRMPPGAGRPSPIYCCGSEEDCPKPQFKSRNVKSKQKNHEQGSTANP
jgi:hypothetical protein